MRASSCRAITRLMARAVTSFYPARQVRKRRHDALAEVHLVLDEQVAESPVASPEINMRKVHRMHEIDRVGLLERALLAMKRIEDLGREESALFAEKVFPDRNLPGTALAESAS